MFRTLGLAWPFAPSTVGVWMCTAAQSARMVPCFVSPLFVTLLADLMSLIMCEILTFTPLITVG